MKIDLCKLFDVEEGEEFKVEEFSLPYRFYDNKLECYDSNLNQWIYSTLGFNKLIASEIIKLPNKKQFSQDTLNFFKMIDKKWKWIAKDKSGDIFGFTGKPRKDKNVWLGDNCNCIDEINQSLFDQILWEDEEPIRIDEYVDRK